MTTDSVQSAIRCAAFLDSAAFPNQTGHIVLVLLLVLVLVAEENENE